MTNKFIIICLICIFTSNICFAQKLNYFDLKYLFEHSVDEANDYVIKKGFEFYKTEIEENGIDKSMSWAFQRNTYSDGADYFLTKYKLDANTGFIWYQLVDVKIFDQIKSYCKSIGFKITNSEINSLGNLCSTYENSIFKIDFCSGINSKSNKNIYFITFNDK